MSLLRTAAITAALHLIAAGVAYAAPEFTFGPLPATVTAGDELVLTWSGVPEDAEELELLLSVDDGRSFKLRASPELDGSQRTWRWRVPAIAAERARLRLRFGKGRREIELGPSTSFCIVLPAGLAPDFEVFHEGGWWDGLAQHLPLGTSALATAGAPQFHAGREAPEALDPLRPLIHLPQQQQPPGGTTGAAGARRPTISLRPFRPRAVPLRN
jgi:hypothetical protein